MTPDARGRARLAFALDYPSLTEARRGAAAVCAHVGVLKVGLELFVRHGPEAVAAVRELGCEVFLDLKLCDIPATVGRAVASAAGLGARYLTVHAAGGTAMLREAVRAAAAAPSPLDIVAVTVLTSLDEADLGSVGVSGSPRQQALRLAELGFAAGVRAFVCSPSEAAALRATVGRQARLVTPGIRPAGAEPADQKRVATAAGAIAAGADLLVVGRPIRDAADPAAAARQIAEQIGHALAAGAD